MQRADAHPYMPQPVRLERVERLTEKESLFVFPRPQGFGFTPGQFIMVGLAGYGEAPISISSPPSEKDMVELCIRRVGSLTTILHRLRAGDTIWIRGPFGRGFPTERMHGKDILFIAGGIGLVPLRSLIKEVLAEREDYGRLTLLYGVKSPKEILFEEELELWQKAGVDVRLTIDRAYPGWKGNVGVVTTLIPKVDIDEDNSVCCIVGPPVMYKYVILSLGNRSVRGEDIYLSLERKMKCGMGKCGHCQINSIYTCEEGPVFTLQEIRHLPEAI